MKLLYLTNGVSGCGGLERVLCTKTNFFIEQYNYDITIITINESNSKRFFSFHDKVNFINIDIDSENKIFRYIDYMRSVSSLVKSISPDIILVCDDGVKGVFIPTWLKTSATLIYERHAALDLNVKSKYLKYLMTKAAKKYDKFVVLTPNCKYEWGDHENIIVIPNPLSNFPLQKSQLNFKRAICVGSLNHNKGYDLLIESLAIINNESWRIDVYGYGDQDSLLEQAKEKGVSLDKLNFKGGSKNIEDEYLSSDFLILPSRTEGFGMVLIEAMSYGLPCIAFDCPNGPRHIISNKVNGYLAEPENIVDLAAKIKEMLSASEERKSMLSEKAIETSKIYSIENIAKKWQEIFEKLTQV